MNRLLRFFAYAILSLPMVLVHQATENIWGSGAVGLIAFVVLYAIDFWITVAAHEAGHAVAAYSFGWKISYVGVFPVAYRLEEKKFSSWTRSSGDLGGVVAITATPGKTRQKSAVVYCAGPVANFALAAIAVSLAMISPPAIGDIVGSVAVMSLLVGIGNLIPWRARNGSKSDGAILLSLMKNRPLPKRKFA
ncbi:MAG TPA: site-2 protease family protein [Rhizomicrobium sp.]